MNEGYDFVRKVAAVFAAFFCLTVFGAVDLSARLIAQAQFESTLHGNPSFELAFAGQTSGGGNTFTPCSSYSAVADSGAGISIQSSGCFGWADPIGLASVWNNATPFTFQDGGTSCAGSVVCTASWANVNAGTQTVTINTATGTDGFVIVQTNSGIGLCAGNGKIFKAKKDSTIEMSLDCNGTLTVNSNDITDAGGNFNLTSTTNGNAQLLVGGSAAKLSSNLAELEIFGASASGNNNILINTSSLATNGAQGDFVDNEACSTAGNSDVLLGTTTAPTNGGCNIVYGGRLITTGSCGTLASPLASNAAACGGDTGYTTASSSSAVVNVPAYSNLNNYHCEGWDTTTHTYAGITNIANTSASQVTFTTSGTTDIVWWRCYGVSGG